jgi:prevent-host-death family protein
MLTITATEIKNAFGRFLEAVQFEPIFISRSGRTSAVMLSNAEYERLKAIEDRYWGEKAMQALEQGALEGEEAQTWFKAMQERFNAGT